MLKWAGIIGALTLIVGILIVAGIIEIAGGILKLAFFLVLGLIAALVIGGWLIKKKITER